MVILKRPLSLSQFFNTTETCSREELRSEKKIVILPSVKVRSRKNRRVVMSCETGDKKEFVKKKETVT